MTYKERIAIAVPNPDANEKTIFNDAADGLLKTKDSSGVVEILATTEGLAAAEPKVYVALLTQAGTDAPVATVLKNTLGGTVVWSYGGVGYYEGTLIGAFTENKTIALISANQYTDSPFILQIARVTSDVVGYTSVGLGGSNSNFGDVTVKIEVYP